MTNTIDTAQDRAVAQRAFEDNDLAHATQHIAWALAADPVDPQSRALLDRIIAAAPDALALVPIDQPQTPYSIWAVRAYVYAHQGRLGEALSLMGQVFRALPERPFFPWVVEWLHAADLSQHVPPEAMSIFLIQLGGTVSDYATDAQRTPVQSIVPALLAYQQHADDAELGLMTAILVRKLGHHDTAIRLAHEAEARQPTYTTATVLGTTYRIAYDLERAIEWFQEALRRADHKAAIEVKLDLGDTYTDSGDYVTALGWYQDVMQTEPEHPWALPFALHHLNLLQPKEGWFEQLKTYAELLPDNTTAQELVGRYPYQMSLSEPTDATIDILRQVAGMDASIEAGSYIRLSNLEAPSGRLALEQFQRERGGSLDVGFQVETIQQPDPRVPAGAVDYLLWTYEGTDARPAVAPPADEVARVVADLAQGRYDFQVWALRARIVARRLSPDAVGDLLATMVHPPERRGPFTTWAWIQRVQMAAAYIIAYLDEGWQGSARQRALTSLMRGPLDWTTEAATVALWRIALDEPDVRADVAAVYAELFDRTPEVGCSYIYALVFCSLQLPDAPEALRVRADAWLARLQ